MRGVTLGSQVVGQHAVFAFFDRNRKPLISTPKAIAAAYRPHQNQG